MNDWVPGGLTCDSSVAGRPDGPGTGVRRRKVKPATTTAPGLFPHPRTAITGLPWPHSGSRLARPADAGAVLQDLRLGAVDVSFVAVPIGMADGRAVNKVATFDPIDISRLFVQPHNAFELLR